MSGGMKEYVMGVLYNRNNDAPLSGYNSGEDYNSGFKGETYYTSRPNTTGPDFPEARYYDVYKYNYENTDYTGKILGDATGEMGPFDSGNISSYYDDYLRMIVGDGPWFIRGGEYDDGTSAGLLAGESGNGTGSQYIGFRLVLAPL